MKMTMKHYIVYTLLLSGLLCGCSQGEDAPDEPTGTPAVGTALEISPLLGSAVFTRAAEALPVGAQIGLFLEKVNPEGPAYGIANRMYQLSTGGWGPNTVDKTIYLGPDATTVYAYYPYTTRDRDNREAMPVRMQSYEESNLLFIATGNQPVSAAHRQVTLALKHAYARLQVTITPSEDYPGKGEIASMIIKNSTLLLSGTLNIATGVVTDYPPVEGGGGSVSFGDYVVEYDPVKTFSAGGSYTEDLLMIPTALKQTDIDDPTTLQIIIRIDGSPITAKIPIKKLPKIESGKLYTVSLKLNGGKVSVAEVTINDWDEKILNDGESFEPTPSVP